MCLLNIRLLLDGRSLQCKTVSANSLNKIDHVRLSSLTLTFSPLAPQPLPSPLPVEENIRESLLVAMLLVHKAKIILASLSRKANPSLTHESQLLG